jgi:hypothetical protein
MEAAGCTLAFGQSPAYFTYQATLRNGNGSRQPHVNQSVMLRLGVYKSTASTHGVLYRKPATGFSQKP